MPIVQRARTMWNKYIRETMTMENKETNDDDATAISLLCTIFKSLVSIYARLLLQIGIPVNNSKTAAKILFRKVEKVCRTTDDNSVKSCSKQKFTKPKLQ